MKALLRHIKTQVEHITLIEVCACVGICAVVVILMLHVIIR
jgi:hypothetical protein